MDIVRQVLEVIFLIALLFAILIGMYQFLFWLGGLWAILLYIAIASGSLAFAIKVLQNARDDY